METLPEKLTHRTCTVKQRKYLFSKLLLSLCVWFYNKTVPQTSVVTLIYCSGAKLFIFANVYYCFLLVETFFINRDF